MYSFSRYKYIEKCINIVVTWCKNIQGVQISQEAMCKANNKKLHG